MGALHSRQEKWKWQQSNIDALTSDPQQCASQAAALYAPSSVLMRTAQHFLALSYALRSATGMGWHLERMLGSDAWVQDLADGRNVQAALPCTHFVRGGLARSLASKGSQVLEPVRDAGAITLQAQTLQ